LTCRILIFNKGRNPTKSGANFIACLCLGYNSVIKAVHEYIRLFFMDLIISRLKAAPTDQVTSYWFVGAAFSRD